MVNYKLKATILEVVDNQLEANDPKCTRRTLNRLMDSGYSEDESKKLIASILVEEIFDVTENKENYNEKQYCKKLAKLPEYVEVGYMDDESVENEKVQAQVVNESKIGRNDPCPCGSEKKYKKCCG